MQSFKDARGKSIDLLERFCRVKEAPRSAAGFLRCLALNFYHHQGARVIYRLFFFTRRTRVSELYVRELAVACGFPMHRYIAPFYFSLEKRPRSLYCFSSLPVKSYTWVLGRGAHTRARAHKQCVLTVASREKA